jgi:hypothetical protein
VAMFRRTRELRSWRGFHHEGWGGRKPADMAIPAISRNVIPAKAESGNP